MHDGRNIYMKAVQINQYGEFDVIQVNDVPKPAVKENLTLVEVYSASINPFDYIVMRGFMKDYIKTGFPFTIGGDFSGKRTDTGEEVFGTAMILSGGSGAFAEYATVNPERMARKPKNIDFIQAASLPLVGSSTVQALEDEIKLRKGQKVLIHGGAGGIGSVAIQLAKHLGARVSTTVAQKDIDFVMNLGADDVIDYKNEKFEEKLKDLDAVFDTIGGETMERSFKVLKKGGVIASMKGQPSEDLAKQYEVKGISINTKTNTSHLNRVKELVEEEIIKPQVDKVFSLSETKEAFIYKQNNHPRGKVILKIR